MVVEVIVKVVMVTVRGMGMMMGMDVKVGMVDGGDCGHGSGLGRSWYGSLPIQTYEGRHDSIPWDMDASIASNGHGN